MNIVRVVLVSFLVLYSVDIRSQKKTIDWISFEQLQDSLAKQPKKVFVSFYADWCIYCKKMEEAAFKNPRVIKILNSEYYAVRMNAESKDTISFLGRKFVNNNVGKSRTPFHEIALAITGKTSQNFALPATLFFDTNFHLGSIYFNYLSPKKIIKVLTGL